MAIIGENVVLARAQNFRQPCRINKKVLSNGSLNRGKVNWEIFINQREPLTRQESNSLDGSFSNRSVLSYETYEAI